MSWKPGDAPEHTKKADTPAKRSRWAEIANERRLACIADGGDSTECDALAIRIANGVIADMEEIQVSNLLQEAEWDAAFINDLPDSSFAIILAGGDKDESGKTVPRTLRKLPYKDSSGKVDVPHLRNALARISQVDAPDAEIAAARRKLEKAAEQYLKTRQDEMAAVALVILLMESKLGTGLIERDERIELAESACGVAVALAESAPVTTNPARAPVSVDFRLIRPGAGNKKDRHYYPEDVLREYGGVFIGAPVFITDHIDAERSERTKVGKVQEIIGFDNGPIGRVIIYDPDVAEKTRNRAAAGELATLEGSIRAEGVARPGKIDGVEYNIVEKLTSGIAYDLVSRAGAGGHAQALAESDTDTEQERQGGGNVTDNMNNEIQSQQESVQETQPVTIAEQQEAEQAAAPPVVLDGAVVADLLDESGLPAASIKRLAETEYAGESALTAAIVAEKAYVAEITNAGQPFGLGESAQAPKGLDAEAYEAKLREIERRHGIIRD